MTKFTLVMKKIKETKNCRVYAPDMQGGTPPAITQLYIQKWKGTADEIIVEISERPAEAGE